MNKTLEYAIKLRDMFTPQMQRVFSFYDRVTASMSRMWGRVEGMLGKSSQTVGNLVGKLRGLASGFKVRVDSSDVDKAATKTTGLLGKLKSLASGSAIVGGLVGGGMAGIVTGAVDMAMQQVGHVYEKTVGAAQAGEATMFRMNELMGKDAAANLVKSIDAYMPSKRNELINSSTMLSGAGVASEKMMDTITALNNVAAITGQSVQEMALIQAKIKATGYVQGDEINMFKERGINLNPYIAQVMGVGENQIAKLQAAGKITYDVFDKAMQAYGGKGGRYEGAAERAMTLTGGKEEAVSAKFDNILKGLGERLLPLKMKILDMFNDVLDGTGPIVAIFERVWMVIRPVWEGIKGLLESFGILNAEGGVSQGIFMGLGHVFGYLSSVLDVVFSVLTSVSEVMGRLIDSALVKLAIGIYAAVTAWGLLNAVMAMNPIILVIGALIALKAAFDYAWNTWDGFRESILYGWAAIKDVFGNIGEFLLKLFSMDFAGALAVVGRTIQSAGAAGRAAVISDRRDKRREREILNSATSPLDFSNPDKPGGTGSLGDAAGLNSTVGNSRSNTITINIGSLIAKSEISVMDFQEGLDDIESKLIDALLRVANSGTRIVPA
jgi:tape measure domain-containing protein